jgi:hypothetical protein
MPTAGPETVARFDELAEMFVARGAERSQMFGMPVLKAGGKVFAGTFGDAMNFKLGPDDLEEARRQPDVEPFEPAKGRAMKEWVLVPLTHAERWVRIVSSGVSATTVRVRASPSRSESSPKNSPRPSSASFLPPGVLPATTFTLPFVIT